MIGIKKMIDTKNLKMPVEVYSRVVGYYRQVSQWHKGKQEEFRQRKLYKLNYDNDRRVFK